MTNYKDNVKYLGYSDIASLTIRNGGKVEILNLGSDGDYSAKIVKDRELIPGHYNKKYEFKNWIWIYDDGGRKTEFEAENIEIYTAGDFGILILLENNTKEKR